MIQVPARIGKYTVDGEIGRGGAGIVYKARDVSLEREVAIKMLRPELAQEPDAQDSLQFATHEHECRGDTG